MKVCNKKYYILLKFFATCMFFAYANNLLYMYTGGKDKEKDKDKKQDGTGGKRGKGNPHGGTNSTNNIYIIEHNVYAYNVRI